MKKTLLSLTLLLTLVFTTAWAQGPNNSGTYYQSADGLKGKALKSKLAGIIVNPTNVGYDGLYEAYKKTDTREDGYVRDWYSNVTKYRHGVDNKGNYSAEGDMYNREHTVPQSWFGSGGIKSDIVHVLPTDGYVNNRRANYPLGEVNHIDYQSQNGYSKLGSCKTTGYSGTVFEPNDEIKGDMARIFFYMITRYESECGGWGHDVFTKSYPGLTKWTLDMMMRWSKQDPVDDREIARNNAVYEVQGNRNPYVDYPGLEDYTWGSMMDVAFSYDSYQGGGSGEIPDDYPDDNPDDNPDDSGDDEGENEAEQPVDGTIALSNAFFGTAFTGALNSNEFGEFSGTQNGITVTYSKGDGNNQYMTDSQLRLYTGNTLTVSVAKSYLTEIAFTIVQNKNNKTIEASTGSVQDGTWTGKAKKVVFCVSAGGGNVQLSQLDVRTDGTDGISELLVHTATPVFYDMQGRRVQKPTKGLYITSGRKVILK